jgi:hypothetical protein
LSIAGYGVYNPYASGPANTDGFQFWQFSRATVAVYGRRLTFEQVVNQHYAGVRYVPLVMQWRVVLLGTAVLMAFGIFTQWLLGLAQWRYLAASRWRKPIFWSLIGLLVALLAVDLWGVYAGFGSLLKALLYRFVLDILAMLPDNPAVIATAGVAIVVVPYFLLERQFRESEIGPVTPRPFGPQ